MRRLYMSASAALLVWIIASCSDITGPAKVDSAAEVTGLPTLHEPVPCTTYNALYTLMQTVVGDVPTANAAYTKLGNVRDKVEGKLNTNTGKRGEPDLLDAKTQAVDLVDFLLKERKAHPFPGTYAQLTTLVNKILCYVGITQSVTDAANTFVVLKSDPVQSLVTGDGNAGIQIGGDAVSEPTIITIAPIPFTVTVPGAGPLHTKLDQYRGFYEFLKISATGAALLKPVVVAVCPAPTVPGTLRNRLRLGHDKLNADGSFAAFEITPPASGAFLTCPFLTASVALAGIQEAGSTASLGELDLSALGGIGGTTVEFSPFGTIDPTVDATGGIGGTTVEFIRASSEAGYSTGSLASATAVDCTRAVVGSSVDISCRPVVAVTTPLGTRLEGAPVKFTVLQGGGQIGAQTTLSACGALASELTLNTNWKGKAAVCWTLGSTEGTNTVTATPGFGGDVPSGAVYTPASLSWSMVAVSPPQDISPPVISDPVITGNEGANGWYTSDVSVSWSVSDPESGATPSACTASVTTDTKGTKLTCTATNGVGLTSTRSITIKRDATAPEISEPAITLPPGLNPGLNGWYTSDVSLSFPVSDGISGVSAKVECEGSVTEDTAGREFVCKATNGAGLTSERKTTIKRDATAPEISAPVITLPPGLNPGLNGWYTSDVSLSFPVSDGISGVSAKVECEGSVTEDTAGRDFVCKATNGAGLTSGLTKTIMRDATLPVVTQFGLRSYTVAENVSITCSAFDATSGVAFTRCANIAGPAYTFTIGTNTATSEAVDNAGNTGSASGTFRVEVTYASLCLLTQRFVSSATVARSMCAKLNSASSAALRGSLQAKSGMLGAYVNEISAQTGKSVSELNANLLIQLAGKL